MIDSTEVRILDMNSEALGVETADLMSNAGSGMAKEIERRFPDPKTAIFVCGTGNNGGDGFVAARRLHEDGWNVSVILTRPPERIGSDLARNAFEALPEDVKVHVAGKGNKKISRIISGADLIVDGMLGAGAKGAPRGIYVDLVKEIESNSKPVASIDIPTGAGFDPHLDADFTVTFHDTKTEMYRGGKPLPECGEIVVVDIGIPSEAATFVGPGDLMRYPKNETMAKKGDGGKVLVIGGGPFTGAPALASMAAGRAGADLVRVAVPAGIQDVIASFSPDLIVHGLGDYNERKLSPGMVDETVEMIEWADSVLIGPGAGRAPDTQEALSSMIRMCIDRDKKTVVDADGITAIAERFPKQDPVARKYGSLLITPHRGELKRIMEERTDLADIDLSRSCVMDSGVPVDLSRELKEAVSELVSVNNIDLLIKGPLDAVFTGSDHTLGSHIDLDSSGTVKMRLNSAGVPSMSTGGTGDVLAGLCAGLASRGMELFDSGCLASYINGKAGEEAFASRGYSMLASDLLDHIIIG